MTTHTGTDTGSLSTNAVAVAEEHEARAALKDRVRWGPVWAGLVVALATFLLLELVLFATGLLTLDLNPTGDSDTAWWVTGLAALAAFFLGGLTAGASAVWRRSDDGLLQGVVVWSLGVVALLVLSLQGFGLLGSLGDTVIQLDAVRNNLDAAEAAQDFDADAAIDAARDTAAAAVLVLGLTLVACAFGGTTGAKMAQARMAPGKVADLR